MFKLGGLFQRKKYAFLINITNKESVINVEATELKKSGCIVFYSYDAADIES